MLWCSCSSLLISVLVSCSLPLLICEITRSQLGVVLQCRRVGLERSGKQIEAEMVDTLVRYQLGELAVDEAHSVPSGDRQTNVLGQIAGTPPSCEITKETNNKTHGEN